MYEGVDVVGGGDSVGGDVMERRRGWILVGGEHTPPPPLDPPVHPTKRTRLGGSHPVWESVCTCGFSF